MEELHFTNQTHTTGSLFQDYLLMQENDVYYAGYTSVHPLKKEILLSFSVFPETDPKHVFDKAKQSILNDIDELSSLL